MLSLLAPHTLTQALFYVPPLLHFKHTFWEQSRPETLALLRSLTFSFSQSLGLGDMN